MISKKRLFFGTSITLAVIGTLVGSVMLGIHTYNQKKILTHDLSFEGKGKFLFISSENFSSKRVQEQLIGLKDVTDKNHIMLDAEFMNFKGIPDISIEELFLEKLKIKFSSIAPYDVILAGDDLALDFALKYRQEFFSSTPVVFFGVENSVKARYASSFSNFTGFIQQIPIKETIEQGFKLNPGATSVTIITDSSASGYAEQVQILEIRSKNPDLSFNIINTDNMTQKELTRTLETLTNDTILIMYSCSKGTDFSIPQRVSQFEFVTKHSNIPVYTFDSLGLNHGAAGGLIMNYTESAAHAAELAVKILSGIQVEYLSCEEEISKSYFYDIKVLKKYDLNSKVLPKNTILLNSKSYSWKIHRDFWRPTIIFLVSYIFLVSLITWLSLLEHRHVNELRNTQKVMEHLITHDFLTELPNRKSILTSYGQIASLNKPFAILLIDIDDFKSINDYYSHSCGDMVLKTISKRFSNLMHENKFLISRFGGDEFLLIYTNGHIDEDNHDLNKLIAIFSEPVTYQDKKIFVQSSIGIANSDPKYTQLDDYIANADIAMYQAKKSGKNQVSFYNESYKESMQNSQEITKLLEDAIENDGFKIMYQPQVDVETNVIHGYEALCRLKSVPMSPSQFIPVAEENGLIIKIARIVTEKVVQQIAEWRHKKIDLHKVAINYSYAQIKDTTYPAFLKGLLQTYDVSPQLIGIEITESLFIENKEEALKLFKSFMDIGISLSLDDFGTGYSSLSYLTYLPVETVKIDKSLIDHYLTDERDRFIKNIVRLVHSLEMKLTVEGVETEYQYERLKDFSCDYIQGYYFSKPISPEEVENFTLDKKEDNKNEKQSDFQKV